MASSTTRHEDINQPTIAQPRPTQQHSPRRTAPYRLEIFRGMLRSQWLTLRRLQGRFTLSIDLRNFRQASTSEITAEVAGQHSSRTQVSQPPRRQDSQYMQARLAQETPMIGGSIAADSVDSDQYGRSSPWVLTTMITPSTTAPSQERPLRTPSEFYPLLHGLFSGARDLPTPDRAIVEDRIRRSWAEFSESLTLPAHASSPQTTTVPDNNAARTQPISQGLSANDNNAIRASSVMENRLQDNINYLMRMRLEGAAQQGFSPVERQILGFPADLYRWKLRRTLCGPRMTISRRTVGWYADKGMATDFAQIHVFALLAIILREEVASTALDQGRLHVIIPENDADSDADDNVWTYKNCDSSCNEMRRRISSAAQSFVISLDGCVIVRLEMVSIFKWSHRLCNGPPRLLGTPAALRPLGEQVDVLALVTALRSLGE